MLDGVSLEVRVFTAIGLSELVQHDIPRVREYRSNERVSICVGTTGIVVVRVVTECYRAATLFLTAQGGIRERPRFLGGLHGQQAAQRRRPSCS